ncbi:GPI transamidase component PIG-T [Mycena latifolia]|nr:GPI transamidase component PIG-T [Mycena latifolia]
MRLLGDGKMVSAFSFEITANQTHLQGHHYTVSFREYAVTEMHLDAGNWDYDRWGSPSEPGVGAGAELWAWMDDSARDRLVYSGARHNWRGLRNSLAALFCVSLGAFDEQRTTSLALAFPRTVGLPLDPLADRQHTTMRHMSLPSEYVCTENLTPFLKLLPCKSSAGISSLLNPHRVFDADWHGMGLHVVWKNDIELVLRLTFQAVSDPLRFSASVAFFSVFWHVIEVACPLSASSHVELEVPADFTYTVTPDPSFSRDGRATFDILNGKSFHGVELSSIHEHAVGTPLDIKLASTSKPLQPSMHSPSSPITARRVLRGSGQALGQMSVVIGNRAAHEVQALYLETMPWIVQLYLHTLHASIDYRPRDDLIHNISYIPSIPPLRAATFQAVLNLPPQSIMHLTFDVKKAFLRYSEHPPDAQRGWNLPQAVLIPLRTDAPQTAGNPLANRIYIRPLLVNLATPDFSMPYNVILLTSIVTAYVFTGVMNILTGSASIF